MKTPKSSAAPESVTPAQGTLQADATNASGPSGDNAPGGINTSESGGHGAASVGGAGDTASPAQTPNRLLANVVAGDTGFAGFALAVGDTTRELETWLEPEDASREALLERTIEALGLDPRKVLPNEEAIADEFAATYPLTTAALKAWKEHGSTGSPRLKVTARQHGFRRGGMAHSAEPAEHLMLRLKPDQVEAILADPDLISEIV